MLEVIRQLHIIDPKLQVLQVNATPGFDRAKVTANVHMTWKELPKSIRELLQRSAAASSENEAQEYHAEAMDAIRGHIRVFFKNNYGIEAELQDLYSTPHPYNRSNADVPGGRVFRHRFRPASRDEMIRMTRNPRAEVSAAGIETKPMVRGRTSKNSSILHKIDPGQSWTPNPDARASPESRVSGANQHVHIRLEKMLRLEEWEKQQKKLEQSVINAPDEH